MKFNHYRHEDQALDGMLPQMKLLAVDPERLTMTERAEHYPVFLPDEQYGFLHEAAVIEYHGMLFASWYNCPETELFGTTPIRGRRSKDGGKTWGEVESLCEDPTGKILYCPPVYGICDDRLYMLVNQMVGADLIHSLDLYEYDEASERFVFRWSRPVPFKLNTNVIALPNGKRMLPGRIAEMDGFPNTPAVLISDSGKIDAEWRLVRIAPDGNLADGSKLVHPEISAFIEDDRIFMFCRDDERNVPLIYLSDDNGETWSGPYAHDIPFSNSKIYAGDLSDGRHYVIGNLWPDRSRLAMFLTEPGSTVFSQGFLLQDGVSGQFGFGEKWHYPVAWESGGKLYVIYTVSIADPRRGAVLSVLDLKR